jgi:hypothetical protein
MGVNGEKLLSGLPQREFEELNSCSITAIIKNSTTLGTSVILNSLNRVCARSSESNGSLFKNGIFFALKVRGRKYNEEKFRSR